MQTRQTRAVIACLLATVVGVWACNDMVAPRRPAQNPIRPAFLINPAGMVTVSPQDMHGWLFYDDQHDTLCTDTTFCALTDGPRGMPLGSGSARLKLDSASDGKALLLPDYGGTRLDDISALSYATFRQSRDPGANLAISLQFNVDYDLTDSATAWQGRLVYEPYLTNGGEVPDTTWQIWNALQGKWWGTKTSVWRQGTQVTNPCLQATPCTWSQVLTYFPNIGIHTRYGAVVLKAGSGWSSFTGNVDALTIGISGVVTTFNFDRSSPTAYVPATAPDSLSSALVDTLGTITRVAYTGPPWIRSLLDVVFNQGVSQDARQAALDAVGGFVVGGNQAPIGEGDYFVRIADTSLAGMARAMDALAGLPQVDAAGPAVVDTIPHFLYRRPHDGTGWQSWALRPDSTSAARMNWALEATSAPMAWGCSTGDTTTELAIVDGGIAQNSPAYGNFSGGQYYNTPAPPNPVGDHGSRMSELLAAVGNDSDRSTGMMWRARLAPWDITVDPKAPTNSLPFTTQDNFTLRLKHYIERAGLAGAAVINVSAGDAWKHGAPSATDTMAVRWREGERHAINDALKALQAAGHTPLLVLAAGNDGIDAKWSGYTESKLDYPNQVLVVGGSTAAQTVWDSSNTGSLVDIYAPADSVWSFGIFLDPVPLNGTSFSAPLGSGVAGLMLAFDPNLSASQLRSLIIQSARTPASAGGNRLLDAYGALRAVAGLPHTPVCGNRLWQDGNSVIIQRNGTVDSIPTALPGPIDWLAPQQGGHTIFYRSLQAYTYKFGELTYHAASQSWTDDTAAAAADWGHVSPDNNAMFNLLSGASEGGDSLVVLLWGLDYPYETTMHINVLVPDTVNFDQTVRHTFTTSPDTIGPFIGAFAPKGGRIFVTVPDSAGTSIYQLDTHIFTPTLLHTFTGRRIYGLSMNDLESEFAVTSGSLAYSALGGNNAVISGDDCKVEFYDTSFALLQSVDSPGSCVFDYVGGGFWGGVGGHAADVIKQVLRPFARKGSPVARPRP